MGINIACLLFLLTVTSTLPVHCKNPQENCHNHSVICPPWTTLDDNCTCQCGDSLNGIVDCLPGGERVNLQLGYCMTFSEHFNDTIVGRCIYSFSRSQNIYYNLFDSVDPPNDLCENFGMNRTGQLCGKCQEGYGLPVYSYSLACVKCEDYKYNWLKYIAISFLPLTLFYFAVVIFRISATAGVACVYILAAQGLTSIEFLRLFKLLLAVHDSTLITILYKFLTLHSVWNLDFFRAFYTPFCLHPNLSTLQSLLLEYVIAVYPFILILITYVFVKLHDRYSLVVQLWRPFYKCFRLIHQEWNIKESLVGVFSTFILLSYTKIITTSFGILRLTLIYSQQGKTLSPASFYYDGNVKFFSKEHLPYAIFAIFMVLIFNVLPLLILCLYPCRCFHTCLNKCRFHSFVLHTFVESFQGHYKIEPRDRRSFAALYPFLRFVCYALLLFSSTQEIFPVSGTILLVSSLLIAIYKPHKKEVHNKLNAFLIGWLALIFYHVSLETHVVLPNLAFLNIVTYVLYTVGVLFDLGFIAYWIVPTKYFGFFVKLVYNLRQSFSKQNVDGQHDADDNINGVDADQVISNLQVDASGTIERTIDVSEFT